MKVIKLKESQLIDLVNKIIKEYDESYEDSYDSDESMDKAELDEFSIAGLKALGKAGKNYFGDKISAAGEKASEIGRNIADKTSQAVKTGSDIYNQGKRNAEIKSLTDRKTMLKKQIEDINDKLRSI